MNIFKKIKEKIVKQFIFGYLHDFLKKIPFNNYRTVVSLLVLFLLVTIPIVPEYAPFLQPLIDYLLPYSDFILDAAEITAVSSSVDKVVTYGKRKYENAEQA